MYQRILVPSDGSDTAALGLREAIKLARNQGGRIRIVHVINDLPLIAPEVAGATLEHVLARLRTDGAVIVKDAEKAVRDAGLEVDSKMLEAIGGPAGEHIVQEARAWPADVIVCGTHGRRGIRRIVMGSDAEYILRHTPVPVLLVRSG